MSKVHNASTETARQHDPAWDTAVECHRQGMSDIQAIKTVWRSMLPPANLSQLATIIGAIYANTYWATTKMDPNHLSTSLQKAGGWSKVDCDAAAAVAFANWFGLFARNDMSNNGSIPKPGALTNSPDVLVNADGQLDPYDMLTKWNSTFYNAATGTKNYAYGRVQSRNIPVSINKPVLRMFYTVAGFGSPPSSWQVLYTLSNNESAVLQGLSTGPIEAGGRAANGAKPEDAFCFMPIGTDQHYCLLATASTEFFANNPLTTVGNFDCQEWITYNGAAGWHNIAVTSANEERLRFYNQDGRPERFAFEAHCYNLPKGTKVSLECKDARLLHSIDSGTIPVAGEYQLVATEAELPANFSGDLTLRFATPDGKALPKGAWIEARMLWVLPPGHIHYERGANQLRAHQSVSSNQAIRLGMGSYSFIGSGK
jgi:hypothetical protein